jgi:myxalamid-type polyketide synthase MxaB
MSTGKSIDEAALMKNALREIRQLRSKLDAFEREKTEPIAVVGMACRFPGAEDANAFWNLLARGEDAITEVPKDRWNIDDYFDADPDAPGKMYTKWGGFIKDIDKFSPAFFGISPREAASMDPQQRLLLEISWQALENAGAAPERLVNRQVGVFVGIGATDYSELEVMQGTGAIDPYNGTGGSFSVAAGRLSYFLGVRGPSVAMDTACSSSLTAVHLAVNSLRNGESEVAIAGGVNLMMSPDSLVSLCKARMLSPDGRCKTFDASANGYVRGEGCGALVLKRLSDAVAEGDNILALLRGSAVNHNGKSGGLTVPSGPAQQELVERALKNSSLTPAEVAYVEAHGTGTAVGDPIEVGALAAVYANRHKQPLLIGSVKSNIGHLEWAAGICGLIKVILAMKHGEIPASLHVKKLNPHLDWDSIPVQVVTEKRRWPAGRRIAGVSSFGFGGTNAHVLVEEPPEAQAPAREFERPLHIFTLSAKSPESLAELTARYESSLNSQNIGNVCFTANAGRNHFEHRLAIVTSSTPELRHQLSAAESAHVPAGRPRIAMLFTGQGAQYAGMGRELFETQPVFRATLERCKEILRGVLDRHLLDEVLFPTPAAATEQLVNQTAYTQPALFAIEYALAQLWRSWGVEPELVIGHSVGEYVAACLAGVFSLEDGLRLIATRGKLMQALPANGAMAAIRAAEEQVMPHLAKYEDKISIAAVNGPHDLVISGERQAVEAIQSVLRTQGIESRQLTVSHAFHSPLMDPILAEFEEAVRAVRLAPPKVGLISNLTGKLVTAEEVTDPHYWVRHLREPVRFRAGMETLAGNDVFIEAGPQPVLLSLGRQCLPGVNALWLPSLSQRRGNWQQMLESLASLYQRGVDIDWQGFDRGYARGKTDLPGYPLERQRYALPKPSSSGRMMGGPNHRPLIESVVQSPAVKETILTTRLSTAAYPYLADHRIYGEVVAPAASYLAMLMNGADALGRNGCRLEDVFFVAPLILAENAQVNLQVVIEPDSEFQMISFVPGGAPEDAVKHVTGRLSSTDTPDLASDVSLAEAQERCTKPLDPDWVSAAAEGIEFGPSFRWIDAIWRGERETLARLRLPDSIGHAADYWLHPGLLDACFQCAEATLGDDVDLPLPFSIGSLVALRRAAGSVWWSYARQVGEFIWDIRLLDSSGAVIIAIDGFEARQASRSAFRRSADWFYRIDWQPRKLAARAAVANGRWLIVDDGTNFGDTVAELLTARRQSAVVVRSGEVPALVANGQRNSYAGMIFIAEGDGASPASAAETTSIAALQVVQALTHAQLAAKCWFVTRGSAVVAGSEISQDGLAQTPLWGFTRTLALEHPELQPRSIDLPPLPEREDLNRWVDDLLGGDDESQVAYRSGLRYVARLVRHRETKRPKPVAPFRLQLAEYGSPDQLTVVPLIRRVPGPGEVEIEVKASALNFRDVLIALGMLKDHYAQVLKIERAQDVRIGFDCAGTIAAIGEGVTAFKVGDEVMTSAAGSSASFLTTAYTDVALKPESLTFEEAATLPTAFFTVHYGLLQLADLKAGETILIHSAAGGVGQAAVQLAKALGAEIFATASPAKWAFLRKQGIKHVMNSRTADFAGEILRLTGGAGVDVVLNSLTGDILDKSFDVLKKGGRFVEIGKLGILTPEEAARRRPDASYITFDVDEDTTKDPLLAFETLNQVRELFDTGKLQPLPQTIFAIEDAVEAYRFLQQAKHVGKVVLSFAQRDGAVRADGSYLITGGLGGLGLGIARHLVEQGARHVVLAGRSAPSTEAQNVIAQLQAKGANVSAVQGDIANEADVARALAACPKPLRGIVHSAGVLDDGIVENQTAERFARVMASKARGAWHLHTQTQMEPLDFFVCFSSMASAMGAAGQINYASANSFLDGLAAHRRALGLCGLSINWGPWAKVGMAAGLSVAGQGIAKIEVEDGLRLFGELLTAQRTSPPQIGVWNVNWPAFQKRLPNAEMPAYLSTMLRQSAPKSTREAARASEFPRRFRETPEAERPALIESVIRPELVEVLGLGANHEIPATQLWADLGVDSLMLVELKNRLERIVSLTLPIEKLARDLTTRKLATFVADKMIETADTPAPAETRPESTAVAMSASEDFEKIYQLVAQIPQAYAIADKQQGRQVKIGGRWRIDFASCNYLGLDLHPEVMAAIPPAVAEWGVHPSWTRAVASPRIYAELEQALAEFVGAPTTLIFPSISLLHAGVIPILAGYDGVILKDTEAHHSLHEGCLRAQVNGAEWLNFPHSDIDDLAKKLAKYRLNRTKIIATDGVYSMGSSHPPLLEYVKLAKTYNATLYVDDAHGFGVIGERPDNTLPYGYRGNGIVRHFDLDYCRDRIVYVAGMSKSFSSYAAFVTCFDDKIKATLESSGPYVFSGPTCTASLASGLAGLRVNAREGDTQRQSIFDMTHRFVTAVKQMGFEVDNGEYFPIVGVVIGGFEEFIQACQLLWEHDILITPAMYPAVPIHRNLVRFSITAANTQAEIDRAINALEAVWNRLHGAAEHIPVAVRG